MSGDFAGKVILVTGGGSGIGRATALAFGATGGTVVVSDVNADDGAKVAAEIAEAGGKAVAIACDVSSSSSVAALFADLKGRFPRLHVAFNNAGIGNPPTVIVDTTDEMFDRIMAVNLRGVWLCQRAELEWMQATGGAIVNMASALGLIAITDYAPYIASKHAVVGLTKAAALEYGPRRIRVNAVCPGIIKTPLAEERLLADPDQLAGVLAMLPNARLGDADEVAALVLWLASDAASFVTGSAVAVDGGWTV